MRSLFFAISLAATGTLALGFAPSPAAFSGPGLGLRGAPAPGLRGVACRAGGDAGGGLDAGSGQVAPALGRRQLLGAALAAAGAALLPAEAALAKKKKEEPAAEGAPAMPTISLKDFYTALYAQEVESVEFDGPSFDRAYVKFSGGTFAGKTLLIGEGYPKESAVNSSGPQQILAKIRNEIKAGNPVTWSWKGAAQFKKKPAAEKSETAADGKDDKGEQKAVQGKEGGKDEKKGDKKEGDKEDKKEDKKGGFPFSLPAPPKAL